MLAKEDMPTSSSIHVLLPHLVGQLNESELDSQIVKELKLFDRTT